MRIAEEIVTDVVKALCSAEKKGCDLERTLQNIVGEYGWDRADKVFLQRAQDILKEFGPLLVEKKLLSQ